ncbi:MAG: hypothetical protein K0S54_2184 [Alphaproteobacteria bacterium]|nr:hypothetical protein [Alphaproteobacteria bacterium]
MALNRQQLAKILELMGSVHDGEALAAARRATLLVRNSGVSWETLLGAQSVTLPVNGVHAAAAPRPERPRPGTGHGRELTSYEMLYALLHSNRTPVPVKRRLKPMETRLEDGDVGEDELIELRALFKRYVVAAAEA